MPDWGAVGRLGAVATVLAFGGQLGLHQAWAARVPSHGGSAHLAAGTGSHSQHVSAGPVRGHGHAELGSPGRFGHASLILLTGHGGGLKHAVYWTRKGRKVPLHYVSTGGGYGGGISCVPYAREVSGIDLKGDAYTWWDEAAGQYARGSRPEPGSVLNFRSHATMRLGHVAVVSALVSRREIEIEHANWWGPGASKSGINRNVSVIDVSPDNDWTEVRVSLGRPGEYGSIYPTYGFIYPRPDGGGTLMAKAPLRRATRSYDEVAEVPGGKDLVLNPTGWTLDAPDRRIK